MKHLQTTLIAIVLFITLASCSQDPVANEQSDYSIDLKLSQQNDTLLAQEVLNLINEHRTSIGLDNLMLGSSFSSAYAVKHTNYMIELSQINHDGFGIRTAALQSAGAHQVGENVAYGYQTAESVFNAWLNSPSHRDNIEGNYTHSGFGIKKSDENNAYYFTQLFYLIQ